MARGKHKARAENRRAHLDTEVMQQLKDENRQLKADLIAVKQDLHEQQIKHEREIAQGIEDRTEEALSHGKKQMELTEDVARAFVRGRTEEIVAMCMTVMDVVPGVSSTNPSHAPLMNLLQANGVEDYEKFFGNVMKANGKVWTRDMTRAMRQVAAVDAYWREREGSYENLKTKALLAMKEISKRHEEEA